MLRQLLLADHGAVGFSQQCGACGSSEHGPLRVQTETGPGPLVSVSYSGGVAAVAVAPAGVAPQGVAAFGIDLELDTPENRLAAFESLAAHPSLTASDGPLRTWTRLESAAKATGTGLRGNWATEPVGFSFDELELPSNPAGIVSIAWRVS